ncbi:MAG: tRNA (N6-isopentenyl adenosine(37)-C2)-methylthiotransferase MiaB [Lachnospiraceae bacterium]|nr:tRNA (N6-isopentenyl adenosine(37)-C2)-methylthiotransferase MiaB [Lachnospiraceae bacterium]
MMDTRQVIEEYLSSDDFRLALSPPESEPLRQYYFIGLLRRWVHTREEALGRSLYACTNTFGCQMNARDSEKMEGVLTAAGFVPTEKEEEADLIIYNTCTVRENANTRVYGRLGYLNSLKKKHPDLLIALCGCMMQEAHVVEKIRKSYRFVDIVFGTHNVHKFAELIWERISGGRMVVDIWDRADRIVEDLPASRKYFFKSGVNISFGCNNFCSYCIVPYVRGRERSRAPEDILAEVRRLASDGVVEIMLLGQNVNSYGKDLAEPMSFAELLRRVSEVEGIERIRFMTSHPKDLSQELIDAMAALPKVCRHLHLPVQSGSSRILEKMNRRYTKEQYLDLVRRLKAAVPDISLTTDIIVGFPGETEEDFLETMDVVRQVCYDSCYTFIYSKRTGTPAASMPDQVPEDVIKDRFDRLLALVGECSAKRTAMHLGETVPVLVEEVNDHDSHMVTGRMDNNLLVHFPAGSRLIGQIVPVRLTECRGFYYIGELVLEK